VMQAGIERPNALDGEPMLDLPAALGEVREAVEAWLPPDTAVLMKEVEYLQERLAEAGVPSIRAEEQTPSATRAALAGTVCLDAVEWWSHHRPNGWSLEQHLGNPRINLSQPWEKDLAMRVAELVAFEKGIRE
jgi:hypothetical protein